MKLNLRPISLAVMVLLAGTAATTTAQEVRRAYIVQLQDQPAASYTGNVAGLAATQPRAGVAFDYQAQNVQDYVQYLGNRQTEVLSTVSAAQVIARYDVVLNGFAALLTDAEVLALKNNPAVADVQADQARQVNTVSTSAFLGLSANGGLWSQFAGGSPLKGENLVIGVVDGGIWPENPSFADRVTGDGTPTFDQSGEIAYGPAPATFKGGCVGGEGFDPAIHCNNKLIGAKFFNSGFLSANLPKNWTEFYSPRDSANGTNGVSTGHGGHGDHTASTAAGNAGVDTVIAGVPMGKASGIAPRARVAAYKVCWTYDDPTNPDGSNSRNTCYNTDTVGAINEAVKDGVNVINYSISGSQTSSADAVEQAFYRASLANVFVAASAGNSGPANQVAHISPWLATVAASTHDRHFQADATLGNNAKYSGASQNVTPVNNAPIVRAEDSGIGGGNPNLCFSSAAAAAAAGQVLLDPAKVAGKIVVCTRGNNARVDKSLAVLNAGGAGMILVDTGGGLVSEPHSVPAVHVTVADGALIKAYAATAGATASISAFYNKPVPAPIMAGFSSRGPNQGDSDILKPDLTAPGVDIIAAVTADLTPAQRDAVANGTFVPPAAYSSYQGTSMSSPHVAGLALLLRQAHPDWSTSAIKSALMTTAYTTLNDGLAGAQNGLLPWAQGAGHVDPNKATDPGLVYDAGKADYVQYQCKVNRALVSPASDCTTIGTLDESYNLNLPSITVGSVQGTIATVVRRKVTNVGSTTATYTATAAVPGFNVVVSPASLTIAPGATASFTVSIAGTTVPLSEWRFGSLEWTDGTHVVRSPIQARTGKAITAPAQFSSTVATSSALFNVRTGFTGRMTAVKGGLKPATLNSVVSLTPGALSSAQLRTACAAGTQLPNMRIYGATVGANTVGIRFALRQQDVSDAGDDFDLGLLGADGSWTYSGNDGSNENVQMAAPIAGNYRVCVVAYGGRATMTHRLSSWIVTTSDVGGNLMAVLPPKSISGNNTPVGVSWSNLAANQRYFGGVQFRDPNGAINATTLLRVDTGTAAVPAAEPDSSKSNVKE